MEWNGIEWKLKVCMSKKPEKAREHMRRCYRPTGGWAMRMKTLVSYKGLGSDKWTGPTDHGMLRSHEVLDVMPYDPQLVVSYRAASKKEKKLDRQFQMDKRYRNRREIK